MPAENAQLVEGGCVKKFKVVTDRFLAFDCEWYNLVGQPGETLEQFKNRITKEGFIDSQKKWVLPASILSVKEL